MTTAGYWLYPTKSNSITTAMANYDVVPFHTTDVGSYAHPSPYGTYDQGGNVYEWNETISGSTRGLRGGMWGAVNTYMKASSRSASLSYFDASG